MLSFLQDKHGNKYDLELKNKIHPFEEFEKN